MLQNIHIKNFTIIEELELDFQAGLTVLTGETGAGKSIIIDAIGLALGTRLDGHVVRQGSDRCDISISFNINDNAAVKTWLTTRELNTEDECVLRRTITKDGRSRSYINGCTSNLSLLSELGEMLLNIHGQHENQALLKRDRQLQLLDSYAGNQKLCQEIKALFSDWRDAKSNFEKLKTLCEDRNSRQDFLKYQLVEFEKVALEENELESLEKEHKKLANADKLLTDCRQALMLIDEQENTSIDLLLNQTVLVLSSIKEIDASVENSFSLLSEAQVQVQEAGAELRNYLNDLEIDPARLQSVESRLMVIHDLARKHRVQPEELFALQGELTQELETINNSDVELGKLQQEMDGLRVQYKEVAAKLTLNRKKAAKKLDTLVTENMHHLAMKGGLFSIKFTRCENDEPHKNGLEQIEFLVSANLDQSLQPLVKVASGGELSRIGLAIQVITAQTVKTPTLIFDEVDSGIGGGTSEIVGRLLRRLGNQAQVLCITHLPQVASLAHNHLQVKKSLVKGKTKTFINDLSHEKRVDEIARMLGGIKITEQTKAHANEMLEGAVETDNCC